MLLKHILLGPSHSIFSIFLMSFLSGLPWEHIKCFFLHFLLLLSFFTFTFLLETHILVPKCWVNLLFHHLLIHSSTFLTHLLISFNGTFLSKELCIFTSKIISGFSETFLIQTSDESLSLSFTFLFQLHESLCHLTTNLFRSFQVVVKLFLILLLLWVKESCQPLSSPFQIGFCLLTNLRYSGSNNVLSDYLICLRLPLCLQSKVHVSPVKVVHVGEPL